MKRGFLLITSLLCLSNCFAQQLEDKITFNTELRKAIDDLSQNTSVNADSAYHVLSSWNKYPGLKTNEDYLFIYKDSFYGDVPVRVFIPKNYKPNVASPMILLLHGAVSSSSFERAYESHMPLNNIFFKYFSDQDYIVVRPFADPSKKFDWAVNRFNMASHYNEINFTFNTINKILAKLKEFLDVDDSKVFAYGHSDGSDGAFGFQIFQPSAFAGFVGYNSMLSNLFSYNIYLKNTINRPLYLVHSDLDDLRPIEQTRAIVKILDSMKASLKYREYRGYTHFDKHLQLDLPESYKWMKKIARQPFPRSIYWETNDTIYNSCDWIKITQYHLDLPAASWQRILNPGSYDKDEKKFTNDPYYYKLNKSAAVEASCDQNIFKISTSRVKGIELFINPSMIDMNKPVVVIVNGKEAFNQKLVGDKNFLLNNFMNTLDRQALWITSLKIKVE